jgi:GDPmannose 4,6-dehydratase
MTNKVAFISGATGMDGAHLARLLLGKGYEVHGLLRRASTFNTGRLDAVRREMPEVEGRLVLHYGDMTDGLSLLRVLEKVRPTEVYNLAAQSHVAVSFETPEYTHDTIAGGTLRLLETIRQMGLPARIYQAGTSEMFGASPPPQSEATPFRPRSPYGIAKLAAHWTAVMYREAYGMHVSNGILFNHEGPTRGETFVTKKVCAQAARWARGERTPLRLGNLDARRDWGHAADYVDGMWRMLQRDQPDDYVLATGESHSVADLLDVAFLEIGCELIWGHGTDILEYVDGRDDGWRCAFAPMPRTISGATAEMVARSDARYVRPLEVDHLCGDAGKARRALGWEPRIKFDALIREMVRAEIGALDGRKAA